MSEVLASISSPFTEVATIPLVARSRRKPPDSPQGRYRAGDTIDEYVIERLIAKHEFAEVYSARGRNHEHVAIKIFRAVRRNEALELFKSELNVAVTLHHPNILEFLKVGPDKNQFYLVMPFCENGTLADWLQVRRQIRVEDAIAILYQLVSALVGTHAKKIVHGDLTPTNIAVSNTAPIHIKIFDFGLATLVGCARLSLGYFCGTPRYAAPERLLGNTYATCAQDLFSVGVIMGEVVTGIPVFRVDGSEWPLHRNEPDLRLVAAIAPHLHDLISAMLSKNPDERPTAADVLKTVEPLLPNTAPIPPRERQITK
jgi:eukaryotic-like serine/threonine-protein kinase